MKITINQLRKIIKEEIESSLQGDDIKKDVKEMILGKQAEIVAMQKDSSRTFEKWEKMMNSIKKEIEALHGKPGIDEYYILAQGELRDLMSFTYPPGHRSPRDYDEPVGTTVHSGWISRGGRSYGRGRRY